jgi:low affinity Fe/Cu permease
LIFDRFARWLERQLGRTGTFVLAFIGVAIWASTGPFFAWSDAWQLVVNTATTVITFLMVFVIQNTQTRDMRGIHLKLDELIRVTIDARNSLMGVEEKTQDAVDLIKKELL